jgi:DNA polymerase III delta subunit
MAAELRPAYLIAGDDGAKIDAALTRLRERAEREGGPGALESFAGEPGKPPDAEALLAALPAMSLTAGRRYLLADAVEGWTAAQAKPVAEALLAGLPPDLTMVMVARERPPKLRAPKGLAEAVEAAGGEVLAYGAPKRGRLASWVVAEAEHRGFGLEPAAARTLVERMGEGTVRLANELDRLALWAGEGGEVTVEDLEAMIADTSEQVTWALSDAIVARDRAGALRAAERLATQGEAVTPLIYQSAKRIREANLAVAELEAGRSEKEAAAALRRELGTHPYAAEKLIARLGDRPSAALHAAACAVADLEWWTRGGSDYPDDVALTVAVRRAAGA